MTPEGGGLTTALTSLFSTFAPVVSYYGVKYPDPTTRGLRARQLGLALTDTFARTAVET